MEIKDIEKLAELARIEMSQEEKEKILGEMGSILGFIDQIQNATLNRSAGQEVDIAEIELGEVRNIMREDENPHESGKYTEDILRETPKVRDSYVEVKKIL